MQTPYRPPLAPDLGLLFPGDNFNRPPAAFLYATSATGAEIQIDLMRLPPLAGDSIDRTDPNATAATVTFFRFDGIAEKFLAYPSPTEFIVNMLLVFFPKIAERA